MDDETHQLISTLKGIAIGAGDIAMEGFRSDELDYGIKKDFHDIVTKYDEACEEFIRDQVLSAYPDSSIVGEETGTTRGSGKYTWYIDPIDGTSNFARGIPIWSVSIGVAVDGQMIAAAVNDAVNNQLFWAAGSEAFLNDTPISSTGYTSPEAATVVANFPLPRDFVFAPEMALEQYKRLQESYGHVKAAGCSTIPLCWIAAGWLDATFGFGSSSWDVAASSLILRNSGASFRTYISGIAHEGFVDTPSTHYLAAVPSGDFRLLEEIMETQSLRPSLN